MLLLHLLQISLVYINTLKFQQVLAGEEQRGILTAEDLLDTFQIFHPINALICIALGWNSNHNLNSSLDPNFYIQNFQYCLFTLLLRLTFFTWVDLLTLLPFGGLYLPAFSHLWLRRHQHDCSKPVHIWNQALLLLCNLLLPDHILFYCRICCLD